MAESKTGKEKKHKKGIDSIGFYFLIIVALLYISLAVVSPVKIVEALSHTLKILTNVVPVLIIVFAAMALTNYFLNPKKASKYLGKESGVRGWLIAIAGGVASIGPIYVWYPMLRNLMEHGMKPSLVAAFLYNRAVKIPLIPLMIYYFGVWFVIVLTILTILASMLNGAIIGVLFKKSEIHPNSKFLGS